MYDYKFCIFAQNPARAPRAEWTELGEQLIARGIYSFKQRQKYIYRANKSHNRANKSHNILKYKTHINTKIQLHGGDGYKSCIMYVWADKTQI